MLKYCSLYSGSSGNCFLIHSSNTNILIDAGVSTKKIITGLLEFNINITDINAILVTHEHTDHIKSIAILSNKYNIPIYANQKTWDAIPEIHSKIADNNINVFNMLKPFKIGELEVLPFPIPHDAAAPCGFNVYQNSKKLTIATDIGHISNELLEHFKNSSSILLESNYDPEILKFSSYPYLLKKRILGDTGHLSNETAGKTLSTLYNYGLKNAILVHLSKENNFPELAYKTVYNELLNCKDFSFDIAPRNNPSKMFDVG